MRGRALIALVTIACLGVPGAAPAAKPSESQTFFRDALLKDAKTTGAVKGLLRSGAGFVDPRSTFVDVTGDAKPDAIVRVTTGGAAGVRAAYVFSTDGVPGPQPKLRAVWRSQSLYRASVRERTGAVLVTTPAYAEGDDVCCPAKVVEREYTWEAKRQTLVRRSSRELEGPGTAVVPVPAPAPQG